MMLVITGLYAACLTALYLLLTARVVMYRGAANIAIGTGNDKVMEARVRAHGNFAEFAPLGLILLAIAEAQGSGAVWLHLCGGLLLAGRVLHGVNFSYGLKQMPLRVGGMILTITSLVLGAILALPL